MPWRKYEAIPSEPSSWYHKLHISASAYPFYYINYTLTTMGAMGVQEEVRRG